MPWPTVPATDLSAPMRASLLHDVRRHPAIEDDYIVLGLVPYHIYLFQPTESHRLQK